MRPNNLENAVRIAGGGAIEIRINPTCVKFLWNVREFLDCLGDFILCFGFFFAAVVIIFFFRGQ